ncbi:MAG: triose-phosphate isomerase [Opitutales bacterium]|nr:triose-phosphate isomerase [Verrucomicrobiota bacterium]
MSRKYLIAGNWKMNLTPDDSAALVEEINAVVGTQTSVQVCVCPPFTSLPVVSDKVEQTEVHLGAQNMHAEPSGAYTGEISAEMLRSLYVSHVILGHSERRQYCGETNASINQKILAAIQANLKPIYCVGETLGEREAGKTMEIVSTQVREGLEGYPSSALDLLVIAYEPVWAIGTGKTATDEMAQEVHAGIRQVLTEMFGEADASSIRILYGGSMKPENAAGLLAQPDVDGGLIGGASLSAKPFCDIVEAAIAAE